MIITFARRCPSSDPSGHLLPVRTGRREGRHWTSLLPATCGEKVPEGRMRGSAEGPGVAIYAHC